LMCPAPSTDGPAPSLGAPRGAPRQTSAAFRASPRGVYMPPGIPGRPRAAPRGFYVPRAIPARPRAVFRAGQSGMSVSSWRNAVFVSGVRTSFSEESLPKEQR
jgi:hypothetical protein